LATLEDSRAISALQQQLFQSRNRATDDAAHQARLLDPSQCVAQ
jgi:hypothetical protein